MTRHKWKLSLSLVTHNTEAVTATLLGALGAHRNGTGLIGEPGCMTMINPPEGKDNALSDASARRAASD